MASHGMANSLRLGRNSITGFETDEIIRTGRLSTFD